MKKAFFLLMAGVITLTSTLSTSAVTPITNPDPHAGKVMVEEDYVSWAYQNGLTKYQYMADFRYNDPVSRQEASKMLVNAIVKVFNIKYASVPKECNTSYLDAKKFDATLAPFIFEACAHDMMHGYNGYFSPTNNILRAEALATIMRAVADMQDTEVDPWYQDYLNKAVSMGLTQLKGSSSDSMINQDITRGEIIEWLYTLKKNMK